MKQYDENKEKENKRKKNKKKKQVRQKKDQSKNHKKNYDKDEFEVRDKKYGKNRKDKDKSNGDRDKGGVSKEKTFYGKSYDKSYDKTYDKTYDEEYIEGTLKMTSRGFAFVEISEDEEDIYIHRTKLNGAMNNDIVKIELVESRGLREEGRVVKVVSRAKEEVVGIFDKQKAYGFVVPQSLREEDVFISKQYTSGAKDGDVVVSKIIKYPDGKSSAEGRITEIIARKNEPGADIKMLIREKGIIETFPSSVLAEAKYVSKSVTESTSNFDSEVEFPHNKIVRRDLRGNLIFTIDGDYSKDFDDAVEIKKNENGNWIIGVHIADVANYVAEGKALDKEALKRGNSIYLLDKVVPMLPTNLSNGICSLNPHEDRLTLSIDMEIDSDLKLVDYNIYESVINSKYRLTYTKVSDFLEAGVLPKEEEWSDDLQKALLAMNNLAMAIRAERERMGSIDFDLDESDIILDEKGIPVEIVIADRRCAHKLIEEFMLMANKTVAEHFYHLQLPFVYRSHRKPEADTMETLRQFLGGVGIAFSGNLDNIHPKQIANILEKAEGTKYGDLVKRVVLRSMQKAVYDTTGEGHFGLSFRYYCHFTSPIRRYSDLMIHRIIKDFINGKDVNIYQEKAEMVSTNCSATERKAIELEREVEKMKKAEYMTYHLGEIYDGIVSGVTSFGVYVELENTVEGMIRLDDLGRDFYEFNQEEKVLVGRKSGERFALGDKVTIEVKDADVFKRQVDFYLMR